MLKVVKVKTTPESVVMADFCTLCNRFRSQVELAMERSELDHGIALGKVVIIMNHKADKYIKKCKALDKL